MAVRRSIGWRNASIDGGAGTTIDGGTGRINVYTGAQPASADAAATGTLLGTLTPSTDVFAAAANGQAAMNAVTNDPSADAGGTAGYCRFYRTGDTVPGSAAVATDRRMDLLIGTDIAIDNAAIVAGGIIALSGWNYVENAG